MDEPFSGRDLLVHDELIETLIDRMNDAREAVDDQATTVLISSHDLGEVESFATRVAFLHQGKLLFAARRIAGGRPAVLGYSSLQLTPPVGRKAAVYRRLHPWASRRDAMVSAPTGRPGSSDNNPRSFTERGLLCADRFSALYRYRCGHSYAHPDVPDAHGFLDVLGRRFDDSDDQGGTAHAPPVCVRNVLISTRSSADWDTCLPVRRTKYDTVTYRAHFHDCFIPRVVFRCCLVVLRRPRNMLIRHHYPVSNNASIRLVFDSSPLGYGEPATKTMDNRCRLDVS